ncbi:pyrazinamidase/nicotinamidase-like, partial [Tropilaelaps mercedesae]
PGPSTEPCAAIAGPCQLAFKYGAITHLAVGEVNQVSQFSERSNRRRQLIDTGQQRFSFDSEGSSTIFSPGANEPSTVRYGGGSQASVATALRSSDARVTLETRAAVAVCMEVFERMAGSENGSVTLQRFTEFFRETFPGSDSDPLFEKRISLMFHKFSREDPDAMSERDFTRIWDRFVRPAMRPKPALVIVDFQNDFITGSLSLKSCPCGQDAEKLIPGLNKMVDLFNDVVYTYDWHPEDHISFIECLGKRKLHETYTVPLQEVTIGTEVVFDIAGEAVVQKMWPRHCVQDTHGAQLHKQLKIKPNAIIVRKAFWNNSRTSHTGLTAALRKRGINNVFVAGLAYDACVSFTALDAVSEGFMTTIIRDLSCAISKEMTAEADSRLNAVHIPFISSDSITKKTLTKPVPWIIVWQHAEKFC